MLFFCLLDSSGSQIGPITSLSPDTLMLPPSRTAYVSVTTVLLHPSLILCSALVVENPQSMVENASVSNRSDNLNDPVSLATLSDEPWRWSPQDASVGCLNKSNANCATHCHVGACNDASKVSQAGIAERKTVSSDASRHNNWQHLYCAACCACVGLAFIGTAFGNSCEVSGSTKSHTLHSVKFYKDSLRCGESSPVLEPSLHLWSRYTLETRVSFDLYAASQAHGIITIPASTVTLSNHNLPYCPHR